MKEEFITIDELSKISRVKVNKISAYVKKGILSYEKQDENTLRRYYNKNKAIIRLSEIKEAEKEGYTTKEMEEYFIKKDFLAKRNTLIVKDKK